MTVRKRRPGADDEFADFAVDQLGALGEVTSKRMFGGHGLYHGGVFFGMAWRGVLLIRIDESFRAELATNGWTVEPPVVAGIEITSYWAVPAEVLDDRDALALWAHRAVAAGRAKAKSKPRRRRTQ